MARIFKIENTYIAPYTDELLDLGHPSFEWKDLYIDGTAYLDAIEMHGSIEMSDNNIVSMGRINGFDNNLYLDLATDGQLKIHAAGSGTPFAIPDVDITGSVFFDDHIGLDTLKQIQLRDTEIYINSSADGILDLTADTSINLNNSVADSDIILNFIGTTNSGVLTWMEDEDYFNFSDDVLFDGTKIGFFGTTPISQVDSYNVTNLSSDRDYDADSTSVEELADVLGTLIQDLEAYGLFTVTHNSPSDSPSDSPSESPSDSPSASESPSSSPSESPSSSPSVSDSPSDSPSTSPSPSDSPSDSPSSSPSPSESPSDSPSESPSSSPSVSDSPSDSPSSSPSPSDSPSDSPSSTPSSSPSGSPSSSPSPSNSPSNSPSESPSDSPSSSPSVAPELIISYPDSNYSTWFKAYSARRIAQIFVAPDNYTVKTVDLYLEKNGTPTGSMYAYLYATSAGEPTTVLATSDAFDISTLSTFALVEFVFSGVEQYDIVYGTVYAIAIGYAGGDSSNCVKLGADSTGTFADGSLYYLDGSWSEYADTDAIFYLYGSENAGTSTSPSNSPSSSPSPSDSPSDSPSTSPS